MSWLTYGLNAENVLIAIEFASRGRTAYRCPYCRGELTAKKGSKKAHHFAHTQDTCRAVRDRDVNDLPLLPTYDKFNLELSSSALRELEQLWSRYGVVDRAFDKPKHRELLAKGCVEFNEYRRRYGGYQFTKLGKIPVAALSLRLFNDEQQLLILGKLDHLRSAAQRALEPDRLRSDRCDTSFPERLTDFKLYCAQLKRLLVNDLYYLKIQANGRTFYKIGVTHRPLDERVAEVEAQLRSHFQTVSIAVLGLWKHRGNVELYFKYRYQDFQYPIGSLTEYYQFEDAQDAKAALSDLRRMKPKELSQVELDILNDVPSAIEQQIEQVRREFMDEEKRKARSSAIQTGMQRAAHGGTHIGRPKGYEAEATFLAKPSTQRVITALEEGLSLRQAADHAKVAVNTVRKVKAILAGDHHP